MAVSKMAPIPHGIHNMAGGKERDRETERETERQTEKRRRRRRGRRREGGRGREYAVKHIRHNESIH